MFLERCPLLFTCTLAGLSADIANQFSHRIRILKDSYSGDSRRAILATGGDAVNGDSAQGQNRD